jgi:CheY-like chemotaxis protein
MGRDEDRFGLAADVVGGRVVNPNYESSVTDPVLPRRARKVMIVDDHDEIRRSLTRLVRTWGHEVAVAEDGDRALSLAAAFQPEFAIVDLSMPGMNGVVLARRLRRVFPAGRLYIIALSGHASGEVREGCLAAGFDDFLDKIGGIETLEQLLGDDRRDFDETPS